MGATLDVVERGRRIAFTFDDVLDYHGGGSPAGAAIAFKLLERALPLLEPGRRGRALERFVFRLGYRGRGVTLVLRPGFVSEAFIALARTDPRDAEQERRLDALKRELAERVMPRRAADVFDVDEPAGRVP